MNLRAMCIIAAIMFGGLIHASPASQSSEAAALEPSKWIVKVVPDPKAAANGEKEFPDTLVFQNKKVLMTECAKYGFEASAYTLEKKGAKWSFRSEQTSKSGTSVWTGEIKGQAIKGKMVWTKEDGTVLNYTFEGVRQ